MNWLSDNWKILFSGVAGTAVMAIIGYFWKRRLGSKEQPPGQLMAQGAKVENSPVANGSNISQTVNSPTVNIFGSPMSPAPVAERAEPARTSPNIVRKAVRRARLRQYAEVWGVGGEDFDDQGFVVAFKNEAQPGRTNVGAQVQAHIILQEEDGTEHTSFSGQWLEHVSGVAEFRVDDTRTLILGLVRAGDFCGLESLRVQDSDGIRFHTRIHSMPDFHSGIVAVRLTDANRGDVLYEGKFRFTTEPLSIEAVS